jgi:hypothetical protein
MQSVRALTTGLIDYAGLFPPSTVSMAEAVKNFATYRESDDSWMLARLVVPTARLDEFEQEARGKLPTDGSAEPWRLSALLPPAGDPKLDDAVERLIAFNGAHADAAAGKAVVDAVEFKGDDTGAIEASVDALPPEIRCFIELPQDRDVRGLVAAVKSAEASAKIRCGGVTSELIPPIESVARFIHACASSRTPFKATAGLHHPLRAEQNLTYEDDPPHGVMHGFLNVLIAAACAMHDDKMTADDLLPIIEATDASAFGFGETGVVAMGCELSNQQLAACREHLFVSIGSCSFDEPREDLRELGLL